MEADCDKGKPTFPKKGKQRDFAMAKKSQKKGYAKSERHFWHSLFYPSTE